MSTIAAPSQLATSEKKRTPYFTAKLLGSGAILAVALFFVRRYVFRYYLHYNQAAFTDPNLGAPNFWTLRVWLLMHMTGGMIALLSGPWQFWTGFRARFARLHRWTGRLFLSGVAIGATGAFRIAVVDSAGWAFGFALFMLAVAWVTTASVALYAILSGRIQIHREWMVRTYVVTFAFVTFRLLSDFSPLSRLQPDGDRIVTIAWACWVIPLLFTEIILQLRAIRSPASSI